MRIRFVATCLIFLAASAFIAHASRPEIVPPRQSFSEFPAQIGSWRSQGEIPLESNVMAVLGVDDYVNRVYYNEDMFPASLYIGYYQSQREGDTMHSPLNCLPGAGWNPVKTGHITVPVAGGSPIEINRIIIQKGIEKQVVLYWYQSHGRSIASEYWGKIYTVVDALRTNRTDAALVRVVCPIAGSDEQVEIFTEEQAVEFATRLFPLLRSYIPS